MAMANINEVNNDTKAPGLRQAVNEVINRINEGGGGSVDVYDDLDSVSTIKALSANMGRVLNERMTGIVAGDAVAQNPWYGKKYIAIGDSITDPTVNTSKNKYCYYIAKALGTVSNDVNNTDGLDNIGVSGMTMTRSDDTNRRSFVEELLDSNTRYGDRGPYQIDWTQYNLATIFLGVNDSFDAYGNSPSVVLGSLNNNDYFPNIRNTLSGKLREFYSAYEMAIGTMLTANPNLRIVLCTPLNVGGLGGIRPYAAAVREIGNKYSCPVIDLFADSGINFANMFGSGFFTGSDTVHPNIEGHKRMAEIAIGRLLQLKPALPVLS